MTLLRILQDSILVIPFLLLNYLIDEIHKSGFLHELYTHFYLLLHSCVCFILFRVSGVTFGTFAYNFSSLPMRVSLAYLQSAG